MSSYYFKNTKYNTIGYSHLRDIQSKRDKFTVLPEFGITVFDADNPPFERDNNYRVHDVYAHIPSRESQIQKRGAYQANQSLTTMYKRKAPSNAYSNARFDAEFGPSAPVARKKARTELQMRAASQQAAWQAKNSLATQVRRLIAGKKKDAADVARLSTNITSTTAMCLTSSTASSTAASATGLIVCDVDKAHINSVLIRGNMQLYPIANTLAQYLATPKPSARARLMVVWFYKPALPPSAAGTLPPITEVLVSDSLDSMIVQDTANAGRFSILSDRMFDLGSNQYVVDTTATQSYAINRSSDRNQLSINYMVKVGKDCSFKAPAVSSNPGGHYDSDAGQTNGLITKGLLVAYILTDGCANVAGTDAGLGDFNITTRLNYTA